jgi:hypothetical protein
MDENILKELELILQKNIGENFNQYRSIYKKIFGREASTCKCNSRHIYGELKEWYELNKNVITKK